MGTCRLVHWAGAQLQAPHRAVRELGYLPEGGAGVYISRWVGVHEGDDFLCWVGEGARGLGWLLRRCWHLFCCQIEIFTNLTPLHPPTRNPPTHDPGGTTAPPPTATASTRCTPSWTSTGGRRPTWMRFWRWSQGSRTGTLRG